MPERLMREVLRASGWRTRFIVYELVAKLFDAPTKPGVSPAPTGRPPAVAAAASLKLRQAAEAKLAATRELRAEERRSRGEDGGGAEGGEEEKDEIDLETARALIAAEVPLMEVRVLGVGIGCGFECSRSACWRACTISCLCTKYTLVWCGSGCS